MEAEQPLANGNHTKDDDLAQAEAAKNAANEHFKGEHDIMEQSEDINVVGVSLDMHISVQSPCSLLRRTRM